jgi:outer membrane protein assembly factor BamB
MARRALIIANDHYNDDAFEDLTAASADAAALQEVLAHPRIGGFTVEPKVGVDRDSAMRAMESFFADASYDDLLLLHLSVHGWKNLHNSLYFVMRDTDLRFPDSTAIPADTISKWMTHSPCQRIVLTLDCCYSGAFPLGRRRRTRKNPTVDVAQPLNGTGRVVITASTSLQFAHENSGTVGSSREAGQPAVFTRALVDGLKDGAADLDRDGKISIHELFDFVNRQVRAEFKGQTPTLSVDNIQGTLIIADAINYQPEALPDTLEAPDSDGRRSELKIGPVHLTRRQALSAVGLVAAGATGLSSGYVVWQDRDNDTTSVTASQMDWSFITDFPVEFSPVVSEGTVYVGGSDLFAVNAATGVQRWAFPTNDMMQAPPAVADGTVYLGGKDDRWRDILIAVDAGTGEQRWAFPTGETLSCAPVVAEETVYISTLDRDVFAVDAATGELRWAFSVDDVVFASPVVDEGVVHFGTANGTLFAVDATTGEQRWAFSVGDRVSSSPVMADGTVYIGSDDGDASNLDGNLFALDAATGGLRWVFPVGNQVIASPAIDKGTLFIGGKDAEGKDNLFAVEAATGEQRWAFPVRIIGTASPVVAQGTVYFGGGGDLYAVDINSGTEQWTFITPLSSGIVSTSPVVAEGTVYFGGMLGNLYAVDATSGIQSWAFPTRSDVFYSPIVADGRVYVVSKDVLYAVML